MDRVISSSTYGFLRLILSKVRDWRIEIRINIVQLFRSNCLQLRLLLTCANREVARRELVNVDYDAFMWLAVRYHVSCLSWRAIDKVKLFNTRIQILSRNIFVWNNWKLKLFPFIYINDNNKKKISRNNNPEQLFFSLMILKKLLENFE